MKITLLSASDSQGGAAIAARRLLNSLSKFKKAEFSLLVRHHKSDKHSAIFPVKQIKKFISSELHPRFILEKLAFTFFQKSSSVRFSFSTNLFGFALLKEQTVINSDVLHFHWINNSFISLKELKTLFQSNKPVVWTFHDMWAFTGGCHYVGDCPGYKSSCGNCPMLKKPNNNDLSHRLFLEKQDMLKNSNLTVVTCSHWLAGKVRESGMLGNKSPIVIPNPIDTSVFCLKDSIESRRKLNLPEDKFLILFGAATVSDKRKGLIYLLDALNKLKTRFPEKSNNIALALVGKMKNQPIEIPGYKVYELGSIHDESTMAAAYSAADCYVLPSLEDNLPNTVMESLSCGTPVVAFNSGGIPEMIKHQETGFLAQSQSSDELMNGIIWMMDSENRKKCSTNAVRFVNENYSESIVAEQYFNLYQKVLGNA